MDMTSADLQAIEARRAAKRAAKMPRLFPAQGCDDEGELHRQILDECKRRGWIVFHGSMAHSTFRTPGEPDMVCLTDNGGLLLIEAKTRTGKLSPDQQAIHAWARKLGHTVHVVRSFEEFVRLAEGNA
jgi:hypothetical protein